MTRHRKTSAARTDHARSGFTGASAVKYLRRLRPVAAALFPAPVVLFVALFAWYLYAVVDLRLVFQARDMLFLWNRHYFTDFVGRPGCLLEWTDNLLVQLCYSGWPAAIAVATAAWLLLVSTIGFMNRSGRATLGGTWVIPAILVVVLFSGYHFPTLPIVGLTLAMFAANGWCRLTVRRPWLRLALFLAVSAVLYYVAGEAYYCFAACCVIYEATVEKRWRSAGLLLLAAVGTKFGLDAILAHLGLASDTYRLLSLDKHDSAEPKWCAILLYCYFPACALLVSLRHAAFALARRLLQRLRRSNEKENPLEYGEDENREKAVRPEHSITRTVVFGWLRWAGGTILMIALAAAAGLHFLDRQQKLSLEISYCAEHQQWSDVLSKARTLPIEAYTPYVNHDVDLALYYTGRLPYSMFSYPQISQPLLNVDEAPRDASIFKPIDLLLELGRLNEAEHLAFEMQEMRPCGRALKRLALITMAKGQSAAASVFLRVLRDDLVWGRWADGYLQRLATDPQLANDVDIQRIRRFMILEDDMDETSRFFAEGQGLVDFGGWLLNLLKRNNENRMAFEYLMAMCLQNRNLSGIDTVSSFLDGFSYPETPPLYEEAAIVCLLESPDSHKNIVTTGSEVFFCGRQISEATMKKYHRLQEIVKSSGGIKKKVKSAVAHEFGDSYFYYYYFAPGGRS